MQKIVQLSSSLVVGIVLARYLGASDYGTYSLLLALTTILSTVSTFGLNHLVTKEIKLSNQDSFNIISNAILIRFIAAIFLAPIFFLIYRYAGESDYLYVVLVVLLLQCFNSFKVVEFYFLSKSDMKPYVTVNIVALLSSVLAKIVMVVMQVELKYFLLLVGGDYVFMGLLSLYVYNRSKGSVSTPWLNSRVFGDLVKKGLPLAFSSLTAVIYLKMDVIMLSYYVPKESVGHYAVAARLSEIWYILPGLLMAAVFPKLLELKKSSCSLYHSGIDRLLYFMVLSSFLLIVFITVFSEFIVYTLFGEQFLPSVDILQIHIWASIFIFMRAVVSKWLIAEDLYYLSLVTHGVGAISNIILNLLMIPELGAKGAAYATLVSYGLASYVSLFLTKDGWPMAARMTWAFLLPTYFVRVKNRVAADKI